VHDSGNGLSDIPGRFSQNLLVGLVVDDGRADGNGVGAPGSRDPGRYDFSHEIARLLVDQPGSEGALGFPFPLYPPAPESSNRHIGLVDQQVALNDKNAHGGLGRIEYLQVFTLEILLEAIGEQGGYVLSLVEGPVRRVGNRLDLKGRILAEGNVRRLPDHRLIAGGATGKQQNGSQS